MQHTEALRLVDGASAGRPVLQGRYAGGNQTPSIKSSCFVGTNLWLVHACAAKQSKFPHETLLREEGFLQLM